MSLVEVSPSTDSMLKVSFTTPESAVCRQSGAMAASVVIKHSMVAMLGWIMPLPLLMPPMRHSLPPSVNSTATSLATVSVVIIASAASCPPLCRSATASLRIPFSNGSSDMG